MTNENILIILSIIFLTSLVIYKFLPTTVNVLGSRQAMETAMQIVREDKPTPVQSSRFYAVVASEYFETTKSSIGNRVYDYRIVEFSTTTLRNVLTQIVNEDNANSEGFIMKVGPEYWDQTKGWTEEDKRPFSPQAVKMTPFIIDDNFTYQVPPPPVYGSEEFKDGLAQVKSAAERRTPEQGALINFWGGVPGTEGPAGIWQNKLYDVTKKYHLSDQLYAYVQMILAKSVADSFRECWKTKFTYQTKRPDMTDSTIPLAMPDPSFPSYVSGHSTVSFAAATVLSKLFPADSEQFFSDATDAKNSRLHAGIHFPYDNDEGEKLGRAIGEFTIGKLNLQKIK
jgi:hypothetical protein